MLRRARLFVIAAAVIILGQPALLGGLGDGTAGAQPKPEPSRGAVALLPLDAGPRLEIYGQAVATEVARALRDGGVEVVVVGASMDVPASARVIVDGTLAVDKGQVVISMRVRNPVDGKLLDTLGATAPGLAQIDKAAADLSARVVPVVRDRLAALTAERPVGDPVRRPPPTAAAPRLLLVGVTGPDAPWRALSDAVDRWARAARREPKILEVRALAGKLAPKEVAAANAERAITFQILSYEVRASPRARDVPLARARVRVRISDASAAVFDRVVVTDTIVGDRGMQTDALAARVAEEVLAILRPHVRRAVSPWP